MYNTLLQYLYVQLMYNLDITFVTTYVQHFHVQHLLQHCDASESLPVVGPTPPRLRLSLYNTAHTNTHTHTHTNIQKT